MSKLICAFFFLSPIIFSGTTKGQDTLTYKQIVQAALENNYGVRIQQKDEAIADKRITRGNAGMLPQVSGGISHSIGRNDTRLELRDLPPIEGTGNTQNFNASVDLTYVIFDGLAMFYRYNALKTTLEMEQSELLQQMENAISQVSAAYFQALLARQTFLAAQNSAALSNNRLEIAETLLKAGKVTNLDVLNARVDLAADSSALLQARMDWFSRKNDIAYLTGLDPLTDFYLDNELMLLTEFSLEQLLESALQKNKLIIQARINKKITGMQYQIYKAARWPIAFINGSYGFNRYQSDVDLYRSRQSQSLSGNAGIRYDIYNGSQRENQIQTGRIEIEKAELVVADVEALVKRDIAISFQEYKTWLERLQIETANIQAAEQAYSNTVESYRAGRVTQLDLRGTQFALLNARNRLNEAKIAAKLTEIELQRLSGLILQEP